jgi:hypothetical protein
MRRAIKRATAAWLAALLLLGSLWPAPAGANGPAGPLGPEIEFRSNADWPSGFAFNYSLFGGGAYDGRYIWMAPAETSTVVKLDTETGLMTSYDSWPTGFVKGNGAFGDAVFDGDSVWLIPSLADRVIQIDPTNGAMTGYQNWPSGLSGSAPRFSGGVFHDGALWLIPSNANQIVRLDKSSGTMTGYAAWPSGFSLQGYDFAGGVFDGQFIWLIPSRADRVIRFDPATGAMEGYNAWPNGLNRAGYAFSGGIFDGNGNVWLIPYSANQIVKLNTSDGEMTGYSDWPSGFDKSGSLLTGPAFDGRSIWVKPSGDGRFLQIDTVTGEISGHYAPAGDYIGSFRKGIFDGLNLWLVPSSASEVLRLSSVPAMDSAVGGSETATLSWSPVNGASGYRVLQSPTAASGYTEATTVSGAVYSHTVTGLTNGTPYYFKVTALFPGDESIASNVMSATPLSDNADLGALSLSAGTLNPAFAHGTDAYTANVGNEVGSLSITATLSDGDGTLTINGAAATDGAAFGPISLNVGSNTITIIATAPSGSTKTYTVTVERAAPAAASGGSGGGSAPVPPRSVIDLNGKEIDPAAFDLEKPSVILETEPKGDSVYAAIPLSVLAGLKERNASFFIEIKTPYGSYRIPVRLAELIPGLDKLLASNGLKAEELSFRITLTDKSGDPAIRTALARELPSGKVMGAIVDYRIELVQAKTGAAIGTADKFAEALTRLIPMPGSRTDMPEQWGAFRYRESTGKPEFVPARKLKIGEAWFAAIRSDSNSIYAVLENEIAFSDMSGHWGRKAAHTAAAKGLVNGVGGGLFAPDRLVTGAEFETMLRRALGRESLTPDATSGRPLTRERMAGMLAGAIGPQTPASAGQGVALDGYRDIGTVHPDYIAAVRTMAKLNVMTGTAANVYEPQRTATRAQAAAVLVRTLVALGMIDE